MYNVSEAVLNSRPVYVEQTIMLHYVPSFYILMLFELQLVILHSCGWLTHCLS